MEQHHPAKATARIAEVFRAFSRLGATSFGGPVAHLGYFRSEFVERRRWLSDADYADLVALCQFLPGPASSQLAFAIGQRRAGLVGAMLASFCFTAPSAVLMIAFAYGAARPGDLSNAGWLHGLKLAAVAVVAQAAWGMSRSLCPDWPRRLIALAVLAVALTLQHAFVQVGAIVLGGCVGLACCRTGIESSRASPSPFRVQAHIAALASLLTVAALLVLLPAVASSIPRREILAFDSFFRSGALVFGGGHVVLPLLHGQVVPRGWVSDEQFLAGYGAAQAVPGPLFTFAAYLGTTMHDGPHAWLVGVWCLLAIFLPAWLLIGGAVPFWNTLRSRPWPRAALRGTNAAVVGLLGSALCVPVISSSVRNVADAATAVVGFALLQWARCPSWLVVVLLAATGQWLLR